MTDHERAIVMAYTGYAMLTGDKLSIFHKYVQDLLGRPVWTHEFGDSKVTDEIKEKAHNDFVSLCRDDEREEISIECDICRSPLTKENSFTLSIASNDETDSDSCMTRYICSKCAIKMRKAYINILYNEG